MFPLQVGGRAPLSAHPHPPHSCGTTAKPAPPPQVLSMKKELNPVELDFLLRFPFKAGVVSPVDFLQHQGWGGIKVGLRP